jgi:hypothetical protein
MKKYVAISIVVMFLSGCDDDNLGYRTMPTETLAQTDSAHNRQISANSKWYQGGTLHKAKALEWQECSDYQNKLATCSDFIAEMWRTEKFTSSIQNKIKAVDDIRPFAIELVSCLNAGFEKDPDPATNDKLFANQDVAGWAALCMKTMGWLK